MTKKTTHFGFKTIDSSEKEHHVRSVFDSVALRYDFMNDLMSLGVHRLWKKTALSLCNIKSGEAALDIASGTGDLAKKIHQAGAFVLQTDINQSMLQQGREKLLNDGVVIPAIQCNAEKLPFPDQHFDLITIAFGLRNMTNIPTVLAECYRILKPKGRIVILEFSKIHTSLKPAYQVYSHKWLPKLGKLIAKDSQSYQYLAESIEMHPDQETLKALIESAHFKHVEFFNLSCGIAAIHRAYRF